MPFRYQIFGNEPLGQLADYIAKNAAPDKTKQSKEHSHNVISSLQSKLANTSDAFKSVLKIRSDNLKLQKERRDQYAVQKDSSHTSMDSPLYHPERRPTKMVGGQDSSSNVASTSVQPVYTASSFSSQPSYGFSQPSNFQQGQQAPPPPNETVIDFGTSSSFTQQLLQDPNQNSAYLEQRDQTIESIESTIAELGQVYSRFASVLAEQREMVQRIDDNIGDVQMNVEGAHGQLLKYYQGISSNRGLIVKSLGVVVVFFTLFVALT